MEKSPIERLVLVLQANPDHQECIVEVLSQRSVAHQIVTIAEGDRALDFLHRRGEFNQAPRPDLILLDVEISGGWDVLTQLKTVINPIKVWVRKQGETFRQLRQLKSNFHAVAMSGIYSVEVLEQLKQIGFHGLLAKPFNAKALLAQLQPMAG
jgi:CheY-like chemotaxis protein